MSNINQSVYLGATWSIRGYVTGIPPVAGGIPNDLFSYAELTLPDPSSRPEYALYNDTGSGKLLVTQSNNGDYSIFDNGYPDATTSASMTLLSSLTPTNIVTRNTKRVGDNINHIIGIRITSDAISVAFVLKLELQETHQWIYVMVSHYSGDNIIDVSLVTNKGTNSYTLSSYGVYLLRFDTHTVPYGTGRVSQMTCTATGTSPVSLDVIGWFSTGKDLGANLPTCFMEGTMIRTPTGDVPIEKLSKGDLILTKSCMSSDMCAKPISYIQVTQMLPIADKPITCCYRIKRCSIGELPTCDLFCTYPHIVYTPEPQYAYEVGEYYNIPHVITYYHLATDSLEIMFANDLPVETLGLTHIR